MTNARYKKEKICFKTIYLGAVSILIFKITCFKITLKVKIAKTIISFLKYFNFS